MHGQRSRSQAGALGALLVFLTACGDGPREAAAVIVRDSAGVEIIENSGDLWLSQDRWRASLEPVVRIGAVDGDDAYLFDRIRGIAALSDGRLVVANGGDNSLRWFDAQGRFLFKRGRTGQGPGEFSGLGEITAAAGDTVAALDRSGRRFILFAPSGELGATTRIVGLPSAPARVHRLLTGDWIVGVGGASSARLPPGASPGVHRMSAPILRVAGDGGRIDTIGVYPSNELELTTTANGSGSVGDARFGRDLSWVVTNDRIVVGTADRLALDFYSVNGKLIRSVRAANVDVRLTPAIDAAYRDFLRARQANESPEERAAGERRISAIDLPDSVPAYSSLLGDDAGNLWVGEYRYDLAPPRRFLVFGADGRFITAITLPQNFRAMTIARDRIWGRETNELEVQYVTAHAIHR